MSFLWDLYQHAQIKAAREDARDAVDAVGAKSAREIADLRERVERLTLANMAMWSLVSERFGLTDAHLEQRMKQLDLSDGKLDGRVSGTAWTCSACKRAIAARHPRCLYCGETRSDAGAFPVR